MSGVDLRDPPDPRDPRNPPIHVIHPKTPLSGILLGPMARRMLILLAFLVLVTGGLTYWYWDGEAPEIVFPDLQVVGAATSLRIKVTDTGKGLSAVEVRLNQQGRNVELGSNAWDAPWFPWESGAAEYVIELADWKQHGLQDGPFELQVTAADHGNLWWLRRSAQVRRSLRFDSVPPRIEVLSGQHYLRQGGSETVLYRLSEADAASGVQVGEQRFLGAPIGKDPQLCLAIFAMAYDQSPEAPITLWAEDAAGNRTQTRFWYRTFPQNFRHRDIAVSDAFIGSVAPEILSHAGLQEAPTPLDTFLTINRELRVRDNARIAELTRAVSAEILWDQPFLQLSNSKVEAVFADRRSYFYEGRKVDEQTHLGFDLASLAQSAVEASNRGRVVFADYLGIYGNTVILDHGLGLYSLYAHLSSFAVEPGQTVERGQAVGRTGQTGLAGGDHLHYSMLVQGVQVNPLEWWDPAWVRVHLMSRLESLHPLQ